MICNKESIEGRFKCQVLLGHFNIDRFKRRDKRRFDYNMIYLAMISKFINSFAVAVSRSLRTIIYMVCKDIMEPLPGCIADKEQQHKG